VDRRVNRAEVIGEEQNIVAPLAQGRQLCAAVV
jgi:hypothetical protein